MTAVAAGATFEFVVPDDLAASEPPEARGLRRDEVRLLVADGHPPRSALFRDLGQFLRPGDALVVNTSATLPAAVDGHRADGTPATVHFSGPAPDGPGWIVELRTASAERIRDAGAGERLDVAGRTMVLAGGYPDPCVVSGSRLWSADIEGMDDVPAFLATAGRPISYGYLRGAWPLPLYQTIFARDPGSAEMPSAGRPFSFELVAELVARGVVLTPITLHTGVSSLESGEAPLPEWFSVPPSTATVLNAARRAGSRVIAVGTTAARAVESVADERGALHSRTGWTDLVLGPDRPVRALDGIITGWHEQSASHLQLLRAVAGSATVQNAYSTALALRFRWHEFGDSALLLSQR